MFAPGDDARREGKPLVAAMFDRLQAFGVRGKGAHVSLVQRLRFWTGSLKRDTVALWIAARDPRTPLLAKLAAGAVAAYALSPLDLIPDFIPVLGYLDDLLIVPLGLALAIRLVPPLLMDEFRARAAQELERPKSFGAAAIIVMLWLIGGAALALWIFAP